MAYFARLSIIVALGFVAGAPVRAEIDLTGSWNLTTFGGTSAATLTQSGTMLTLGAYTGSFDPNTRSFALEAPPQPGGVLFPDLNGGLPYGPSPPATYDGVVSADGNSFDGTQVIWIIKTTPGGNQEYFPWFAFDYAVHGVRRDLTKCGDGQIDATELCDDGAANGSNNCCSSLCTVIDTDRDGTCDALDDCPLIYDYSQNCAVPLTLAAARAALSGQVRTRGVLSRRMTTLSAGTITVGARTQSFTFGSCRSNFPLGTRLSCSSSDGLVRGYWRRRSMSDDWTFRLIAYGLPGTISMDGPIRLEIDDHVNSRMAQGSLDQCTASGSHVSCAP